MKRKIAYLFIDISLFITGCSSKTTVELNENETENVENIQNEKENKEDDIVEKEVAPTNNAEKNSEPVSVILTMFSLDNAETIENYVSRLKVENNSDSYTIYDETHYFSTPQLMDI